MRTTVFVEKNELACEALWANFTSPVFEGDLGNVDTLKRLHPLKGPGLNSATGGFPCQEFSRQGDQQGMIFEVIVFTLSCDLHGFFSWMQCSWSVSTT